jgi:hypothetical protein
VTAVTVTGVSAGVALAATVADQDGGSSGPTPAVTSRSAPRPVPTRVQATARTAASGTVSPPASPRPAGTPHPTASPTASPTPSAPTAAAQSYQFYDSATPWDIPGDPVIATYANGPHPVLPSEVAGRAHVLWIDITGADPAAAILDVEPGCATVSAIGPWVSQKLTAEPHSLAIVYTSLSEWPAAQAAVAALPSQQQAQVRWWIADPTGVPHVVPGSAATQWYWGPDYDISTATSSF